MDYAFYTSLGEWEPSGSLTRVGDIGATRLSMEQRAVLILLRFPNVTMRKRSNTYFFGLTRPVGGQPCDSFGLVAKTLLTFC